MKKIYTVTAYLSAGTIRLAPNYGTPDGFGNYTFYPGFSSKEEAENALVGDEFCGIPFEIVPEWTDEVGKEIIGRAENGRWCPVTVKKIMDALFERIDGVEEDVWDFSFLCKNQLCSLTVTQDDTLLFQVEDLEGNYKEKEIDFNPCWYEIHTFRPYLYGFRMAYDCANVFMELLK